MEVMFQPIRVRRKESVTDRYFKKFRRMRKNEDLCDLRIKAGGRSIIAHRVLLAAASSYFHELFSTKGHQTRELDLTLAIEPDALETVVNFIYGEAILITEKNVKPIQAAATYLGVEELIARCRQPNEKSLKFETVGDVRHFATENSFTSLVKKCDDYIEENLAYVYNHYKETVSKLPFSALKDIVSKNSLNVANEETVYDIVINWVKEAPDERQGKLFELLSLVRLTQLHYMFLRKRVATERFILISEPCRALVNEAIEYYTSRRTVATPTRFDTSPRLYNHVGKNTSFFKNEVYCGIYAVCFSPAFGFGVRYYDPEEEIWVEFIAGQQDLKSEYNSSNYPPHSGQTKPAKIEELTGPLIVYGVAQSMTVNKSEFDAIDNPHLPPRQRKVELKELKHPIAEIFHQSQSDVLASRSQARQRVKMLKSVSYTSQSVTVDLQSERGSFRYTGHSGELSQVSKSAKRYTYPFGKNTASWLPDRTKEFANSDIRYVIGVKDSIYVFYFRSYVAFNLRTLTWTKSQRLNIHPSLVDSEMGAHRDEIFGFCGKIIFCFFPEKNSMEIKKFRNKACVFRPSIISVGEHVYALGGYDASYQLTDNVERWCPTKSDCEKLSAMKFSRVNHGCAAVNNRIYVCGGLGVRGELDAVEVFDPKTNNWHDVNSMIIPRSRFSLILWKTKLYAIGQKEYRRAHEVQVYDPENNKWEISYPMSISYDADIGIAAVSFPVRSRCKKREEENYLL